VTVQWPDVRFADNDQSSGGDIVRSCSNSAGGSPEGTGGATIAILDSDRPNRLEADDPYGNEGGVREARGRTIAMPRLR
jgi:hypothetical protein